MSTFGIIYIIGCVVTFVLVVRLFIKIWETDLTVNDLLFAICIAFVASLLSWLGVIISIIDIYGDKVVIKHKKQ